MAWRYTGAVGLLPVLALLSRSFIGIMVFLFVLIPVLICVGALARLVAYIGARKMLAGFWGTLAFGQKLGLEIGFRLLRR